jgi:hypothetical protein
VHLVFNQLHGDGILQQHTVVRPMGKIQQFLQVELEQQWFFLSGLEMDV